MSFGLCNAPASFQRCIMSIFSDMFVRARRRRSVSEIDGVSTSEYCDGAHGPYRCTSGSDTVALLGSRFTESHHAYIWLHNLKCAGGQTNDRRRNIEVTYLWMQSILLLIVSCMSDVAVVATQDNEQKQRRSHGKIRALCTKDRMRTH
jgi:hypothetical protein